MKKYTFFLLLLLILGQTPRSIAQCSICTKTAQQLGAGPAKALNKGIIYLAFTPLAIIGLLGFRWWKVNHLTEEQPND